MFNFEKKYFMDWIQIGTFIIAALHLFISGRISFIKYKFERQEKNDKAKSIEDAFVGTLRDEVSYTDSKGVTRKGIIPREQAIIEILDKNLFLTKENNRLTDENKSLRILISVRKWLFAIWFMSVINKIFYPSSRKTSK